MSRKYHTRKQGFWLFALCILLTVSLYAPNAFAKFDDSLIKSKYALLIDAKTGSVLYQKNAQTQAWPASTTKILTALVILDEANLSDTFTVGAEIDRFTSNSSLMGLKRGEKITYKDALHGLLIVSGNDAAASMAVNLAGSVSAFVDKMNAKAAEIGMTHTHFTNPHGVQDTDHYTTPEDMGKLAMYAIKNYPEFVKIVSMEKYTTEPTNKSQARELLNSNKLITKNPKEPTDIQYYYPYATGIKTGLTEKYAGGCVVASAKKGNVELIAIIMGDETSKYNHRWVEAKELFEYGFANSVSMPLKDLALPANLIEPVQVALANDNDPNGGLLELIPRIQDQTITCLSEDIQRIQADPSLIKVIVTPERPYEAPIKKGDVVATAAYKLGDDTLCVVALESARDVDAAAVNQGESPLPTVNTLTPFTTKPIRDPAITGPLLYAIIGVVVVLAGLCVFRIIQIRNKRRARSHISRRRSQKFYTYRERR